MSTTSVIKASYMNKTKWRAVLDVIVAQRLHCRVKLLEATEAARPGAPIVLYYYRGQPQFLPEHTLFSPSDGYWEEPSIGPFRPRDIEWLALSRETFASIRDQLPSNLALVEKADQVVVLGYAMDHG